MWNLLKRGVTTTRVQRVKARSFRSVFKGYEAVVMVTGWFEAAARSQRSVSCSSILFFFFFFLQPFCPTCFMYRLHRCVQGAAIDFLFAYKWLMPAGGGGGGATRLHFFCGDTPEALLKCLCCFFPPSRYSHVVVSCHTLSPGKRTCCRALACTELKGHQNFGFRSSRHNTIITHICGRETRLLFCISEWGDVIFCL